MSTVRQASVLGMRWSAARPSAMAQQAADAARDGVLGQRRVGELAEFLQAGLPVRHPQLAAMVRCCGASGPRISRARSTRAPAATAARALRRKLASSKLASRVREELLARCRAERIEPPSAGHCYRIIRSALRQAEQALTARVTARLGPDASTRLAALAETASLSTLRWTRPRAGI
jgi:hypothetical protein